MEILVEGSNGLEQQNENGRGSWNTLTAKPGDVFRLADDDKVISKLVKSGEDLIVISNEGELSVVKNFFQPIAINEIAPSIIVDKNTYQPEDFRNTRDFVFSPMLEPLGPLLHNIYFFNFLSTEELSFDPLYIPFERTKIAEALFHLDKSEDEFPIARDIDNGPPISIVDTLTVNEDTPATTTASLLLSNDSDPDGDALTLVGVNHDALGTIFHDTNTGNISYDPVGSFDTLQEGESSIDDFSYVITDGTHTVAGTVVVTVTGINDAPVAVDDVGVTNEDSSIRLDVLSNDLDPDNTDLEIASLDTSGLSGDATIDTATGEVVYDPSGLFDSLQEGETHSESFTYIVTDGAATDQGSVTITITGVNDAPVAGDDSATADEDTAVNIDVLANDTDVDSTSLTLINTGPTTGGGTATINTSTNTVDYDPNGAFESLNVGETATDTFTYTVTDEDGGTSTANVTVTITGVNDAPVAGDDSATTDEDTAVNIDVLANDTDVDSTSLTLINTGPTTGGGTATINTSTNTVDYDPNGAFESLNVGETASDTFTYTVTDEDGGTSTANVTVTITGVNDAPVAGDDSATADEDTAVTIDVLANDTDVDSTSLTLIKTGPTTGGGTATINTSTNTVDYDPNGAFESLNVGETASDTFTYTVTDEDGGTSTANVTVTITGVNDAPVAGDDSATTDEDTAVNIDVLANDTDVDSTSLTLINTGPTTGGGTATINTSTNTVDYDPNGAFESLNVGETASDTFTYTVTDEDGGTSTANVTVTITGVNDAPVAGDDSATTDEDTAVNIDVLANDTDVDSTSLTLINTGPTTGGGTATINTSTNTVDYDPNGAFESLNVGETASDTFTYTVTDEDGGTSTANVTVTITGVNDAPVAGDDSATTDEDTAVNIDVLANDTDVDSTSLTLINTGPTTGGGATSINTATNTVDYDPNGAFESLNVGETASDTFTYTVTDEDGGTSTANVTVTITGVNDAPVAGDDSATTDEDTAVNIDVLANDTDVDSTSLTLINTGPTTGGGTASINTSTNTVDYDPNGAFESLNVGETASDTFTYTVTDEDGGTSTANVTVTITGVNDAPTLLDDTATTDEDTAVNIDVLANDTDVDSTSLTLINTGPTTGGGTATINTSTNTVDYDPNGAFESLNVGETASDTFTYTVTDEDGGTSTANVTVTITGVNDAPNLTDDTATTDEDTAVNIDVLANDTDVDSTSLTLINTGPTTGGGAASINTTTNTVDYDPNGAFESLNVGETASDTFTYTVTDEDGGTSTANVTVTITGVNDAPVAGDDSATTDEDTAVNIDVLANDTDVDSTSLTLINTGPTTGGGTATINTSTNTVDYDPNGAFESLNVGETASDTFTYTVTDEDGGTSTANVTVTITGVNDAPVAGDDSATTDEDTAVNIDVLANDTDVDSTSLTLINTGPTTGGGATSINTATNTVDYDPNGAFESLNVGETASDTFTYTVTDEDGGTSTANVTVTITGVNDAPVAGDDSATTDEDTAVNIDVLANDTDVDSTSLTLINTGPTTGGGAASINTTTNTVDYDPNGAFESLNVGETASDTFTYTVTDEDGGTSTANVTVTITGVNDAPTLLDDTATTDEDTAVNIDVLANDTDVDSTSLTLINTGPTTGGGTASINTTTNTVDYDPNGAFESLNVGETASDTFTYTVTDEDGGTSTANVTVTITGVNDAPTLLDDTATTDEDTAVNIDVLANDTDVDSTSLTLINTGPTTGGGTASINTSTNTVDYDPNGAFESLNVGETASDTFTYTVTDEDGGTSTANVTVTITGVNDAPTLLDDSATTDEDTAVNIDVLANDTDVDSTALTVTSVGSPTGGLASVNTSTNTVDYDPNGAFESLNVGETASDTFTYTVTDEDGGTSTANVTVTITGVNDAPTLLDDTATTDEDTAVNIDVLANDTDVDSTSLTLINTGPTTGGGAASINTTTNTVDYDPNGAFESLNVGETASDTFTYTVTDEDGGTSTANVTVTITGVNDAPTLLDDTATTDEDTAVNIDVLANDTDVDSTSLTLINTGLTTGGGATSINTTTNTVDYDPNGAFESLNVGETASDTFTYTVTDEDGGTSTANVTVTITGVNDAPVAGDDSATTDEDTAVNIDVLANDTDVDSTSLTLINTGPTTGGGAASINTTTNTVDYDPNGAFESLNVGETASDTFTYTVTDEDGGTSTANVTVTITGVNDAPTLLDDTATTDEDTAVNIDVLANDTDVDSTSLTLINTGPTTGGGTATINTSTNTVDYDPNGAFESLNVGETASDTFTYTVTDEDGGTSTANVTVTITGVNDAPTLLDDTATTDEDTAVNIDVLANDTDVDSTSLTLINTGPTTGGGTATINTSTNTVDYDPNGAFESLNVGETATDTFTYTVTDEDGGTSTANVTVTITGVNDAPNLTDDTATTDEDTAVNIDVLANDTDVDSTSLTLINTGPTTGGGTASINTTTNTVDYDPNGAFESLNVGETASDTFTYTVTDEDGGTSTANVTVTITGVNDAPTLLDDTATTDEDTAVNIDVLANDTDVDSTSLTLINTGPTTGGGAASINTTTNTVDYDPNGAFESLNVGETASDTFTYTVTDEDGGTSTANVTVTITGVNDAPTLLDDTATTDEDTAVNIDVLANDTDVDSTSLTLINTGPTTGGGTASINTTTNTVDYDPNGAFESLNVGETASDTFTYTVTDEDGGTSTANVTVTITGVNDAPTLLDDTATTDEDTAVNIDVLANDTDVDSTSLTLINTGPTTGGGTATINTSTNTVDYDPNGAFESLNVGETATDTFTYTVTDEDGGTSTANVTVTITGVNDAPNLTDDTATTDEDTAVNIDVLANDTDVDSTSLTLINTGPTTGGGTASINTTTNTVDYDPNGAFESLNVGETASDTFTYTVTDEDGGTSTANVTVTITGVNDAPTLLDDSATTDEDTAVNIDVLANDTDVDSTALTVTSVGSPTGGLASVNTSTNTVDYDPNGAFESLNVGETASDTFTYTVTDEDGGTSTANVTVTITGVNDAPTLLDDTATTDEDTAVNIDVLANDTDVDSTSLTLINTGPTTGGGAASINTTTNTVDYDPNGAFESLNVGETASDTFTYTVTDEDGGTSTANVTVTITGVNDAPTLLDDTATTDEDTAVNIDVLANDTDVDSTSLTLINTGPTTGGGTATINTSTNTVDYDPNGAFESLNVGETASDTFTYTVTDEDGGTSTANVTVTITGVNDAPTLLDDTATTDEDTAVNIDVLANDTDVDSTSLTLINTGPTTGGGAASINTTTNTVDYDPNGAFESLNVGETASDTFTYTVTDEDGGTSTANVTVTITGVNDAPTLLDDSATTDEDTAVNIDVLANDTDVDSTALTVTSVGSPTGGLASVNTSTNTVDYDPNGAFESLNVGETASDTFTYTVTDEDGGTSTANVTVTITGVNDAPTLLDDTATTDEDTAVNIDVLANDTDVDSTSLTLINTGPTTGGGTATINTSTNTVDYDPNGAFESLNVGETATDTFTYTVTDEDGGTSTANVTVTITGVNDAPNLTDDTATTDEDTAVNIDVLANDTDVDSTALTVTSVGSPTGGLASVNTSTNTVDYDPNGAFESLNVGETASDTFTYTVTDEDGGTSTANVTVTITGVNDAPTLLDDTATTDEDTAVNIDVLANDTDVDSTSLTLINTGPTTGGGTATINTSTNTVDYDPNGAFESLNVGETASDTFTYTVTDEDGGTSTANVTVTITGVNDAPNLTDDTATTDEDTAVNIDVLANDTDVDSTALTVTSVGSPTGGLASVNTSTNTVDYDPNGAFESLNVGETASDTFTYTVTDEDGGTSTANVTVTITGVNDAPVAGDDSATTDEDTAVNIDVLANDTDVDSTSLTLINTGPTTGGGAASINTTTNTVDYDPNGAFESLNVGETASDTFTYTVTDEDGGTSTANVTVTITGVNDAPTLLDDTATTDEDTAVNIDVLANDTDVDSTSLTLINTGPTTGGGTATINTSTNTVDYDPNGAFESLNVGETASDTFTYTVTDEDGGTSTANVTVTITGVNDAPTLLDDTATTDEDTAVNIDVLANDTDVDSTSLTLINTGPTTGGGTATINTSTNTVDYDPNGAFESLNVGETASDTFTYTVTDEDGGTSTANVTVTITGVNDAPTLLDDTATTDEDTAVNIDVLANDTDVDSTSLTLINTGLTTGGGATSINTTTNTVDYDPNGAFESLNVGETASDTFTYTVTDEDGGTSTANVTVTITGVNDAPVAGDDSATTDEDTAVNIDVLANDTDVDSTSLTLINTGATTGGGTASINTTTNTVDYDPNGAFESLNVGETASDTFTYTVTDEDGGTSTANVTVTITGVNDAPTLLDDTATTDEDTAVNIDVLANDTDVDSTSLTLINTGPTTGGGTASINTTTNTVDYDPNGTFESLNVGETASDTFTYTVTDEDGGTSTANVTVTITGVNDAPTLLDDTATTDEDTAVNIDVLANDTDVDSTSLTLINTGPTTGGGTATINTSTNTVDYDPNGAFESLNVGETASDTFTYTVTDEDGGTSTANVTVTISGVNDAPNLTDDTATTDEDTAVNIDVLANDTDVDSTSLTLINTGATTGGGTATINTSTNTVDYDPNGAFESLNVGETASDTFTYTVTDEDGGTSTANVTVTITGVNDAPVAADDTATTDEDTAVNIDVLSNDFDPDSLLSISAVNSTGTLGSVVINTTTNTIDYDPNGAFDTLIAGFTATDTFTYTASDGTLTDDATVIVTITGLNEAPVIDLNDSDTTASDFNVAYTARTGEGILSDSDLSVVDPDSNIASATITITNIQDAGNEFLSLLNPTVLGGTGITSSYSTSTGVLTLTGTNTPLIYQAVLSQVAYENNATSPEFDTLRVITFTITDTAANVSNTATAYVNMGFTIPGLAAGDESGNAVAIVGDVNGDGYADYAIGAANANSTDGETYIIFGTSSGYNNSFDLNTLNGANGFVLQGNNSQDLGTQVNTAGDINGDGFDDIIVSGATTVLADTDFVIFGQSTAFAATIDVSTLSGTDGFAMNTGSIPNGESVGYIDDFNGDGLADMVVGSDTGFPVHVIYGSTNTFGASIDLTSLTGTQGFTITSGATGSTLGVHVNNAGDFNGDGFADLIIADREFDVGGDVSGRAYVLYGSSTGFTGTIDIATLTATDALILDGLAVGDAANKLDVHGAGDINGDGVDDVLVGVPSSDTSFNDAGAVYVVYGQTTTQLGSLDLTALNGTNGFIIVGDALLDSAGTSVSSIGDFNGDGYADIIVGVPGEDTGTSDDGAAYIIFGTSNGFAATFDLGDLNGSNGVKVLGNEDNFTSSSGFNAGNAVSGGDDINADGYDDVIVGSSQTSNTAVDSDEGETIVIFGRAQENINFLGSSAGETLTGTASSERFDGKAGNDTINAGGGDDIIVGGLGDDVIDGGAGDDIILAAGGDDTITYDTADVTRIDGGSGVDTLTFNTVDDLDLTAVNAVDYYNRYENIEVIELNGNGVTLTLTDTDLLQLTNTPPDQTKMPTVSGNTFEHLLRVNGDATDTVATNTGWTFNGIVNVAGDDYLEYQQGNAVLQVRGTINTPNLNNPPVAADDTATTDEQTAVNIDVLANDVDVDSTALSIASVGATTGGGIATINTTTNTIDYSPNGSFDTLGVGQTAIDTFTYTVSDGSLTDTATVTVTITGIADQTPQFDLNEGDPTSINYAIGYTPRSGIGVLGDDLALSTFAGAQVASATITLTNIQDVGNELLQVRNTGVLSGTGVSTSYNTTTGELTLTGNNTAAVYRDILAEVGYRNTALAPEFGTLREVTFSVTDVNAEVSETAYSYVNLGFSIEDSSARLETGDNPEVGYDAAILGDINGDGFDDYALTSSNRNNVDGEVYVVFGKASGYNHSFDLNTLNGINGFTLQGPFSEDSQFGRSISSAGDFDGDGFDDFIISSEPDLAADVTAYFVYGRSTPFAASMNIDSLNGSDGFVIELAEGFVGHVDDLNGDGLSEIVGSNFVIYGTTDPVPSIVDIPTLVGTPGVAFSITSSEFASNFTGANNGGDFNGDGFGDLLVVDGSGLNPGAYVLYGRSTAYTGTVDLSSLTATDALKITGFNSGDADEQEDVYAAGDINGDGIDDIMVGFGDSQIARGGVHVIFGQTNTALGSFDIASINGSNGFLILGEDGQDQAGSSVHHAGDFNGDGYSDIIISAAEHGTPDPRSGAAYIVFGNPNGFSATLDLDALNGTNGFRILGIDNLTNDVVNREHDGVSSGDINGDGFDDVIIASGDVSNTAQYSDEGESQIIFGRAQVPIDFTGTSSSETLNGVSGNVDETFDAKSGNDTINALGGNDLLIGGVGNDSLFGGEGNDRLIGGTGSDFLDGDSGDDVIIGGAGFDTIVYDAADVTRVDGGSGVDTLTFNTSDDLNLTAVNAIDYYHRYENIEVIELNGQGVTLTLTDFDLIKLTNTPPDQSDMPTASGNTFEHLLRVNGTSSDTVITNSGWSFVGTVTVSGDLYLEYQQGQAHLQVRATVSTPNLPVPVTPPEVDLNASNTTTTDYNVAYIPGASLGLLRDSDAAITDAHNDISSLTVTITNIQDSGNELLSLSNPSVLAGTGITSSYDTSTGVLTLSGESTAAVYTAILRTIAYENTATSPTFDTVRSISFVVTDPAANTGSATAYVNMGFSVPGLAVGDETGNAVAMIGDVNGDGFADYAIGAPDVSSGAGEVYVVFGTSSGAISSVDLGSLNGSNGFRLLGNNGQNLGEQINLLGDINGDGLDDFIVAGARSVSEDSDYVILGKSTAFAATIDVSALTAADGFALNAGTVPNGASVGYIDDTNGDGLADIVVGSDTTEPVYVLYGSTNSFGTSVNLSTLTASEGIGIINTTTGSTHGISVSNAGDFNGDGFADLLIADTETAGDQSGRAYILFGAASAPSIVDLAFLSSPNLVVLDGLTAGDASLSLDVSSAGDINGDGFDDIMFAVPGRNASLTDNGAVYVLFGSTKADTVATIDLTGSFLGFTIVGDEQLDSGGTSISNIGDFNGDGHDDIIIGVPGEDTAQTDEGAAYIIFGRAGGFASTLDLGNLDGHNGIKVLGQEDSFSSGAFNAGISVSGGGDINGDGFDDVIVGSPGTSHTATDSDEGASFVIFGALQDPIDFLGASSGETLDGVAGNNDEVFDGRGGNDTINADAGNDILIGGEGNDILRGQQGDDVLIGGLGDDILIGGGGNDIYIGGAGDDILRVALNDVTRVDGGSGEDTLDINGSGVTFDFDNFNQNVFTSIERIDIDGSGANTLNIGLEDVLDISDELIESGLSGNSLVIDGGTDDTITSADTWTSAGTASVGGVTYNEYTIGNATLYVDPDINQAGL